VLNSTCISHQLKVVQKKDYNFCKFTIIKITVKILSSMQIQVIHLKKSILLSLTVIVLLSKLICNVILLHDLTTASYYKKKDNNDIQTFENN